MTTVKEIAEKANVSIGTVDRVIHNRGRVSPDTKKRIEAIIEELNYSPNFFARNLRRSRNYKFAILMPKPEQDNSFWNLIWLGMERAIKELSAYNIEFCVCFFDRHSDRSFNLQSRKALTFAPDGYIIAPILNDLFRQFIQLIPKNIPYIFVDSKIEGSKPISYIGHHPYQSGILAGRLMELMMRPTGGTIAVIRSYLQEYHMDMRARGFHSFFESKADFALIDFNITGVENRENYFKVLDNAFSLNSGVKGIFVTNVYAHFVAEYLAEKEIKERPFIIGYDLVKENIKGMKENHIDFIISHRPDMQGYNAVMRMYDFRVIKRKIEEEPIIPIDIITKENVEFII